MVMTTSTLRGLAATSQAVESGGSADKGSTWPNQATAEVPRFDPERAASPRKVDELWVECGLGDESHEPVLLHFVYPPIPDRRFDWQVTRGSYDLGDKVGWGATEAEAIADLFEKEAE